MPTPTNPFPCVGIRTCSDYSPFGVVLDGRTVSGGYRFGFNGKESIKVVSGEENFYDFEARFHDARLCRSISMDKHFKNYVELSPYNFVSNNPIIYIDPDGNDIVYFNNSGVEVNRIKSNTVFKAKVDLEGNGEYKDAPMPNIIKGYEHPKYQIHDYKIAAETFIFNNSKSSERPKTKDGLSLDGMQPVKLSPTLVKSIALEETGLGTIPGEAGQNGLNDIMQVNVTTTGGETDWYNSKAKYGLQKNKSASIELSIHAGIRILYSKGLVTSDVKYNSSGKPSEDSKVSWIGGDLDSWWDAVKQYNGRTDIDSNGNEYRINYVTKIYKNWNNSFYSQDAKYYTNDKQ